MRYFTFIILLAAACSILTADEIAAQQTVPAAPSAVSGFKVRLIQASECAPSAAEVPHELRSADLQPGYRLTFLIEAEHMTRIWDHSLVLDLLKIKSGRDFRMVGNEKNYKQGFPTQVARDGRHGTFVIESSENVFGEASGIQVHGYILVSTAGGEEKLQSEPVDIAKKQRLRLADFEIEIGSGPSSNPLGAMMAPVLGAAAGSSTMLNVTVEGDPSRLANVDVIRQGRRLARRGWTKSGNRGSYEFDMAGDGPARIELTCWKQLDDVQVPFSHNLTDSDAKALAVEAPPPKPMRPKALPNSSLPAIVAPTPAVGPFARPVVTYGESPNGAPSITTYVPSYDGTRPVAVDNGPAQVGAGRPTAFPAPRTSVPVATDGLFARPAVFGDASGSVIPLVAFDERFPPGLVLDHGQGTSPRYRGKLLGGNVYASDEKPAGLKEPPRLAGNYSDEVRLVFWLRSLPIGTVVDRGAGVEMRYGCRYSHDGMFLAPDVPPDQKVKAIPVKW